MPRTSVAVTHSQAIADRLAEEIIRGQVAPGTRLDEQSLATRFKVSRSPVRDALRQLAANLDEWTQFILKQTEDVTELITAAPTSGIWRMRPDGSIGYARRDTDWHTIADETEAFYLRIAGEGQYRYPGADLGILVTRGRFMNAEHELLDRARDWITQIKGQFASVPPGGQEPTLVKPEPFGFKML